MFSLFMGCSSLTSVDISNFDTSFVLNIHNMFSECPKLEFLNITHFVFDFDFIENYYDMFEGDSSLHLVIKSDLYYDIILQNEYLYEIYENITIVN